MREKLIITRNFFYKLFLIGFVLNVLFQLIVLAIGGQGLSDASKILELQPQFLIQLLIISVTTVRIFLVYFVLCPALALHWTISKDKLLNKAD